MALLKNYHNSSMIESSEYDFDTCNLIIEFKNGQEYEYYDVDEDTYNSLCEASSTGKFFIANIKESFNYNKI